MKSFLRLLVLMPFALILILLIIIGCLVGAKFLTINKLKTSTTTGYISPNNEPVAPWDGQIPKESLYVTEQQREEEIILEFLLTQKNLL